VGVVSQFDLLVHDREKTEHVDPEYVDANPAMHRRLRENFQIEKVDRTRVRDVMTPLVFTVSPDAPAGTVVEDMLGRKVHRLFVVDNNGLLVGVISALDILRFLRYMEPAAV
jgi:CBS domain-containing protein